MPKNTNDGLTRSGTGAL